LNNILTRYQSLFHPVVPFDAATDKLLQLDLTGANPEISSAIVSDTNLFSRYISGRLKAAGARYAIGGYNENRTVYSRSTVFDADKPGEEPRRLHLGTDIWGEEGTPVFAPLGGMVHSFNYNNHYGDYGATIILLHQLDGLPFYTLYGHLALRDIDHLSEGQYVVRGEEIAHFGPIAENGNWPPHLHFQVIYDMGTFRGDYPGVCKVSEKAKWLDNSPDPDVILQLNKHV
jgi:peptidoglycan LD-endopeptidase LytH